MPMPMPSEAGLLTKSLSAELTACHFVTIASPAVGSSIEPETSSITYMSSGRRWASTSVPAHGVSTLDDPPLAFVPPALTKLGPPPLNTRPPPVPLPAPVLLGSALTFEDSVDPQADAQNASKHDDAKADQAMRWSLM